ncbi:hypothetical protein Ancab_017258 [Ancistrocladus abbreviatus]
MLRDLEAVTAQIFESLLCYIAGPKMTSKKSSWFTISKLIHHNTVCAKAEIATTEFEGADAALPLLASQKKKTGINYVHDQLRSQMMQMEYAIQDLDEQLESLYRHMVRTSSGLLNILVTFMHCLKETHYLTCSSKNDHIPGLAVVVVVVGLRVW